MLVELDKAVQDKDVLRAGGKAVGEDSPEEDGTKGTHEEEFNRTDAEEGTATVDRGGYRLVKKLKHNLKVEDTAVEVLILVIVYSRGVIRQSLVGVDKQDITRIRLR
jgi:hypothetical protein